MSTFLKKDLPTLLIALVGFVIVIEWFVPIKELSDLKTYLGMIATIITNATVLIGTIYAVTSELDAVRRHKTLEQYIISGSFFGMILLLGAVCIFYGGLDAGYNAEFKWYQYNIYQPQTSAMYAVMFLFQCGALYRVCRARSMEATVMLVVGGIFIISNIPLFSSYVPFVEPLGAFVIDGPSLGGTRPANITAAIGAVIIGLRALFGKEQATMETR